MDASPEEVRLHPPWKEALRVLLLQGLPYGTKIERSRLVQLFGLADPSTAAQQRQFELDWMENFEALRAELLEEHRLYLRTLWGKGAYEVTDPTRQTDVALHEGAQDVKKALRKMARTLAFVRQEELTEEQRRKNADAQAKTAMLAGMARKQLSQ